MASNSTLKPITLYGGVVGPNPPKVAFILEELNIPYIAKMIPVPELKQPAYEKINPNGRIPAIEDPNTGLTLWESGAIIEYLVAKYDVDNKLSFPAGSNEDFLCKQWLYFQVSGQGPYYGQAVWFNAYHPEKVPSAVDRYVKEVRRVSGVLEGVLKDREYLVGGKCTFADLAFVTWQIVLDGMLKEYFDQEKEFPNVWAWLQRLKGRPVVGRILEESAAKMAEMRKSEGAH